MTNQAEQLISQDLKRPKMITVATYQALHSAMNQVVGDGLIEDTDDSLNKSILIFKISISEKHLGPRFRDSLFG